MVLENALPAYSTLIHRASQLRLSALTIAEGMRTGSFRSMFRGQGIEFSGVREYLHGDDVRAIDWNVTARMGKPFVKMFNEERELIVFLIIDRSFSMETGTANKSRLQTACETGALLTFAAEQSACPIGAVFFDGEINASYAPKSGRDHVMTLIKTLDTPPENPLPGSALDRALRGAASLLKNRSLAVIVSDFRTVGYETELARLAAKHDVVAIMVADKSDSQLDFSASIPFEDPETHMRERLPTYSTAFKRQWEQSGHERKQKWTSACLKRGVTPLIISTGDDPAQALARFFARELT